MATRKASDYTAILDNLLNGKALPASLKRTVTGAFISAKSAARLDSFDRQAFNDNIAKEIAAKLALQPLIAVCVEHKCKCGNKWQDFGFYARKVAVSVPGEADLLVTKRIGYEPTGEPVTATEWIPQQEESCAACYIEPMVEASLGGMPEPKRIGKDDEPAPVVVEHTEFDWKPYVCPTHVPGPANIFPRVDTHASSLALHNRVPSSDGPKHFIGGVIEGDVK